jgi:DNA-binding response OmpR family regulator
MINPSRYRLKESMSAILVITADGLGQHLLDALLSLHGYDVIFADCGRQGLELFRFTSPDVVMLDLNIPDMKALTVLRQIRKLHAQQPVIVLAGDGTSNHEHRVRALGVNEVIDKAVVPRRIVGALKRLLNTHGSSKGRGLQLTHGEWRTVS